MASALVSFMLQKLDKVYLDYIQQEVITLVVGVEEDVEKLTTTFKVIQAVLYDAELRQIKDEAVKLWLQEFKDIAYDMDDVLDEWSFEMHRSQIDSEEGNNKKKVISSYLCSLCSCFSKVALRHNIGAKIKDIKERLDQAEMEKNRYRLIEIKTDEKPIQRLKSSSLIDVSDIVGRVTDKETIMRKLMFLGESSTCTSNNQQESSSIQALHSPNIISIVGMGGLGKTTLAQLIFNDDEVKTHFEKTMWVCVSNTFDLVTVTKAIIEEADCEVPKSSEWNALHHCLCDSIKGKRFLLVLDDVWTEDRSIWEPLEVSFRYGAKGSQILVTTRNERVAYMMSTTHTHYLGNLSNDDCSSLLSRIALAGRNKENHEDFKELGESISKKCKGLPLAAKTLGGLLHFKKSKKEWLSILESEIWKLEEVENGFLKPALLLSYYDLPLPLKGCFAYCSVFPKDFTIEKDFLVKLWMAQGFLKNTSRNEEFEMIGEDYFNNLAMRSFFQDLSKDNNGNIIRCKMHDLVHDFAQFLTMTECSVTLNNGTQFLNSSGRVRHLTLVCDQEEVGRPKDSYDHFTSLVYKAKKLRTLQIFNGYKLAIKDATADLFYRFRCLKVLCLNDFGLESLSSEIENLIHLRYLDLSNNYKLEILPETISNLYNLQTLKLKSCHSLCELPREMWRLTNLRHLDISGSNKLSHIPQGIGGLTSLRTLSEFIVGGASEGCKISELKNLNLLQGDLSIMGLGRVETVNEAFEMELKQKNLHTLALGFKPDEETENELEPNLENIQRMKEVLEVLEPHPDLVELRVIDYLGFKLSRWIERTSFLCHMRILRLYNCINLTKLPAVGHLPSLEVLDIKKANKVKHIGIEFSTNGIERVNRVAFPKLKELYIFGMDNLEVWELEHGVVMPCLRCISLVNCPKLKTLPALGKLPFLEELVIREANELEWEVGVIAGKGAESIMPCLREVEICGFKKLGPFLEVLSKMSSLKHISISGEATEFIKYVRHDFDDDGVYVVREALFPNLEKLQLWLMDIEELKIGINVMPSLTHLDISNCDKLSSLQGLSKLETLSLYECSSLHELPLPNLKDLTLMGAIHPSLPQAFASTVCALEYLTMVSCFSLTCIPEQVQQLTSLQTLWIGSCGDELKQRCGKDKGEDWRIISHIPNVTII